MAGEIQLNSTSFASESGGTITINNATLASAVSLSNHYASTSEVQGTHPTGTITTGTNSLTVSDATGINVGDYVTGEGIAPGTTVSAVSGTSITLSGTVGATLSSDAVGFYKADKVLSPGLVAGQLCRAWVNLNGDSVAIRASYNVASITDNGTGNYTITFATAMPDTNYFWVASAGQDNAAQQNFVSSPTSTAIATWKTTNSLNLQSVYANNSVNNDPEDFSVAVYR